MGVGQSGLLFLVVLLVEMGQGLELDNALTQSRNLVENTVMVMAAIMKTVRKETVL